MTGWSFFRILMRTASTATSSNQGSIKARTMTMATTEQGDNSEMMTGPVLLVRGQNDIRHDVDSMKRTLFEMDRGQGRGQGQEIDEFSEPWKIFTRSMTCNPRRVRPVRAFVLLKIGLFTTGYAGRNRLTRENIGPFQCIDAKDACWYYCCWRMLTFYKRDCFSFNLP